MLVEDEDEEDGGSNVGSTGSEHLPGGTARLVEVASGAAAAAPF